MARKGGKDTRAHTERQRKGERAREKDGGRKKRGREREIEKETDRGRERKRSGRNVQLALPSTDDSFCSVRFFASTPAATPKGG